ncbi:MAG: hypothetical protein JXJ22_07385 [Bacteroidales bacterium]|nr:hypothetical protein [Bacteroidales bacterium]
MKQILYFLFFATLLFNSCSKDEINIPECDVENPILELNWLNEVKNSFTNCTCDISILQGEYKNKPVFFVMINDPVCNTIFEVTLWDCNGKTIKEYKPGDIDKFNNEVSNTNVLYTCSDD